MQQDKKFGCESSDLGRRLDELHRSIQADLDKTKEKTLSEDEIQSLELILKDIIQRGCFLDCIPREYLDEMQKQLRGHGILFEMDFSNYQGRNLAVCHNHGLSNRPYVYRIRNPLKQDVFLEQEDKRVVPYCESCRLEKTYRELRGEIV